MSTEPIDGYCSECNEALIADLCPTVGCFGLPASVLSASDRQLAVVAESEEAARSLVPMLSGHKKKLDYLGYRYSGRTMLDSMMRTQVDKKTVLEWRTHDPKFRQVESELAGPNRHAIRQEIQSLIFLRNFHLFQMKDASVLEKDEENLTDYDKKYLLEIRKNYTPQTREAIERVTRSGEPQHSGEMEEMMIRVRRYVGKGGMLNIEESIVDA